MKKYIIITAFVLFANEIVLPQCSDAGVCSIAAHSETANNNSVTFSIGYGYSGKSEDITFKSLNIDGSISISKDLNLAVNLPYNFQSGPLGSVDGVGDVNALINYIVLSNNEYNLVVTGGVKLAASKINSKNNFPQAYQSGLGTNDLLIGASFGYHDFTFSFGYQLAGGRNTRVITGLKRGDDILLSGGYGIEMSDTKLSAELLFIKRLGNSSFVDPAPGMNDLIEIPESAQSQLNLMLKVNHDLGGNFSFAGVFAIPFLKRDINIDGLTRKFTVNGGIEYRF